jgi:CubicO group peptidase (beta-lactamase class C family)
MVLVTVGGLALVGCGGPATRRDAGVEESADASLPDGGDRWDKVRALVHAAALDAGTDLALVVWDATDTKLVEVDHGTFTSDTRVAIASASKHISGLVLFDQVRLGRLALSSTTGAVLGWTGPMAAITLEQLLSFTSGLPPNAPCTSNPLTSLAACVDTISGLAPVATPGTRFDYGSTHLHVAARMAEVASGKSWKALFDETLRVPLGLPTEVAYFTAPKQGLGQANPLIAGGLRASMNEYSPMLQVAFHRGTRGPLTVGLPALFEAQAKEPFDVVIGNSPVVALGYPFHYGLTAWLECPTPRTGCTTLSSPGAFGFTPWFDRQAGYSAILGMEVDRAAQQTPDGVVNFAVDLEQALQPLIRDALAR